MNIFDSILGIKLDEDFTDTSWWADAVFRALEREGLNHQAEESEVAGSGDSQGSELI
jgi:hypothetical protein